MSDAQTTAGFRQRWQALRRFVNEDIWDVELSALNPPRRHGIQLLRVLQLVWRDFRDDECLLHASALTFSTMMSLVPVVALSLALARGLGGQEVAQDWIRHRVSEWTSGFGHMPTLVSTTDSGAPSAEDADAAAETPDPDAVAADALARQINRIVEAGFEKMGNVSFGALGGVGLGVLVWMVIAVLGQVEASFNRVWGVTIERPFWRKFTDYLSVLFILPLLLIAASSLPLADFATRYLDATSAGVVRGILGSGALKHATVLVMTTLAFTFLIMFMPNTRVRATAGLTGGAVAALCFLVWLWVCASLQVGAARAGKIYGSFATLPILLAWVNVSWQIVFIGAEVAFAVQNANTYRLEHGAYRANVRARMIVALSVVADAARQMLSDGRPFDVAQYARERGVPVRLLYGTLDELVKAGLMAEVTGAQGQFALLRAPDTIHVSEVMQVVMRAGVQPGVLGLGRVPAPVIEAFERCAKGADDAVAGVTVRDVAMANVPIGVRS